jgi:hypothetical protein
MLIGFSCSSHNTRYLSICSYLVFAITKSIPVCARRLHVLIASCINLTFRRKVRINGIGLQVVMHIEDKECTLVGINQAEAINPDVAIMIFDLLMC